MDDDFNRRAECGCQATHAMDRRQVIRIAAAGAAMALAPFSAMAADERPQSGDLLVGDDVESDPIAIKASDLQPGKPVLAFPFDAATRKIRNDSRLNKVVLVKIADADLDAESKQRAAGGVLAYSAICTHQACEAKTWIGADKTLVCFCHASKFAVLEAGRVVAGPAPRALPNLPLALKGDELAIAGPFSTPPGGSR